MSATKVFMRSCLIALLASVAAAGCATSGGEKPTAAIAKAEASIDAAEASGGREFGAAELDVARGKLTQAKLEEERGKNMEAARLADQASLDAELAAAKGLTGKANTSLAQLDDSTDTLREELDRQQKTPTQEGM